MKMITLTAYFTEILFKELIFSKTIIQHMAAK